MKSYVKHDSIIKNRMVVCGCDRTTIHRPTMPSPRQKAQLIPCSVVIYNKVGIINEIVAMKRYKSKDVRPLKYESINLTRP